LCPDGRVMEVLIVRITWPCGRAAAMSLQRWDEFTTMATRTQRRSNKAVKGSDGALQGDAIPWCGESSAQRREA
jgi:hypothetical protein